MIQLIVDEIIRLSQNEGLYDGEIAKKLGYSRLTIQNARTKHKIPTANIENRLDKKYVCACCKRTIYIRRCESKAAVCPDCKSTVQEKNNMRPEIAL